MDGYDQIPLFHVGCRVRIGEDIKATLTGICIRAKYHVTYECSWWDGNAYNSKWLEQFEVEKYAESSSDRIGFSPTSH